MKKTKTIDRTLTPKTGEVQPGMVTERMVSNDTCATEHLLGTYCTLLPAGESQLRRHQNAECAWYLVKGRIKAVIVEANGTLIEEVCKAGDAGYINPGDSHQEINLSIEENAEIIMCFANPDNKKCNCFADLGTEVINK
jgi:uncharacterized RmlC-like cupin family protein